MTVAGVPLLPCQPLVPGYGTEPQTPSNGVRCMIKRKPRVRANKKKNNVKFCADTILSRRKNRELFIYWLHQPSPLAVLMAPLELYKLTWQWSREGTWATLATDQCPFAAASFNEQLPRMDLVPIHVLHQVSVRPDLPNYLLYFPSYSL